MTTTVLLAFVVGVLCVALVALVAYRRARAIEADVRWWAELHDAPTHVRRLER
jgi:hypothetical protein